MKFLPSKTCFLDDLGMVSGNFSDTSENYQKLIFIAFLILHFQEKLKIFLKMPIYLVLILKFFKIPPFSIPAYYHCFDVEIDELPLFRCCRCRGTLFNIFQKSANKMQKKFIFVQFFDFVKLLSFDKFDHIIKRAQKYFILHILMIFNDSRVNPNS